jgi:arylsulfatase A-like enzyme
MGWGQGQIPNDFPHTLAGELRQAGYRTHLVGKGHFHPQRASMGFESHELDESGRTLINGFMDEYRAWFAAHAPPGVTPDDHGVYWNSWHARPWHTEEHLHPTAWTMSRALAFLENHGRGRDPERPFFLNISFARPHSPYVPPRPYWEQYIHQETPPPFVGDWAEMHNRPEDAVDPNAWRGKMPPQAIHRARAGYYGEVSFIDTQVGRLINWMSRFGRDMLAKTWFLFTSDHGDMQGDHNLWRKTYAYEGSTHIPFLVVPAGRLTGHTGDVRCVADEVVELRDVLPTLLDAVGLPAPRTVDGRSLLPLMQGATHRGSTGRGSTGRGVADEWRNYIHGEHCTCYSTEQEMQYVTDGRRKYVWLPRLGIEQFFDLEQDPGECDNLIGDVERDGEIARWRGYLIEELAARECGWVREGRLVTPPDEPLVSPYREVRWQGALMEA